MTTGDEASGVPYKDLQEVTSLLLRVAPFLRCSSCVAEQLGMLVMTPLLRMGNERFCSLGRRTTTRSIPPIPAGLRTTVRPIRQRAPRLTSKRPPYRGGAARTRRRTYFKLEDIEMQFRTSRVSAGPTFDAIARTGDATHQALPVLGMAGAFAVLTGATVTNTGATVVTGNLTLDAQGDHTAGFIRRQCAGE